MAALLFSRVGIDGYLFRDEAIYAYGGQQMAHGVPPYESTFDPKGPMATFVAGIAAAFAHLVGKDDLTMMRLAFYACSVLTALGVYLLVLQIWHSVVGGFAAAVVFASFRGFAVDALRGPDAHTLGPLFAVFAMRFALRRQWFRAGVLGALAALVKQTYIVYMVLPIVAALIYTPAERRWRAFAQSVAGAALPFIGTVAYFAANNALRVSYESTVVFPAMGFRRARQLSVPQRLKHIVGVSWRNYQLSGILFWIGTTLLVAVGVVFLARAGRQWPRRLLDPVLFIVGGTMLFQWVYTALDFVSYPDLYQLLPYAAAGFGAVVALADQRYRRPLMLRTPLRVRGVTGGVLGATLVLTGLSWVWFTDARANNHRLPAQRAMGCAVNRIVPAGTRLYAIGDPVPLVLTHRRNPDRYIYLESGVSAWKIKHTRGGFAGWVRQVTSPTNSVIVFQGWQGRDVAPLKRAIRHAGYERGFVGSWRVFVDRAALKNARTHGMRVTRRPTPWPLRRSGKKFAVQRCGS